MNPYLQKESKQENTNKEDVRSCDRCEERVYAKEGKSVSIVKREKIYEFINEQLRKEYIKPSKLPQIALVFFIRKKDGKKNIVQDYRYLNE